MNERVAVVTGGAGSIGSAIVQRLERDGHRTTVLDREQCDLGNADDVRAIAAGLGRVDVLVHAAAAFDQAALDDADLDVWRHVQAVNVESALLLTQACVPGMRDRRWGRIVMIVSDTVWSPPAPELLAYVASKSALIGMTRVLALELGRHGITVNAVAPGLTPTPAATTGIPAAEFAAIRARQALPRSLTPDDVAGTVAFLCTDAAEAITGQALSVDGGLVFR